MDRIEGLLSGTLGYVLSEVASGYAVLARRALGDEPRLHRARSARGPLRNGRGPEGAHPRPAARIHRRAVARDVESLVPRWARALSLEAFLERLPEIDEAWERRVRDAAADGAVLRYVATVTPSKIAVGLRAVPASSPLAAIKGSDNQLVFTTARYKANPLVITGPGAGAEVTAAGVLNDILRLAGA